MALKAGPLKGQDLSLLRAGKSVLRTPDGRVWSLKRLGDGGVILLNLVTGSTLLTEADCCRYIGEDLGDGWISWAGGENPFAAQEEVEVEYDDGNGETNMFSDEVDWDQVTSFRLTPSPQPADVAEAGEVRDDEERGEAFAEGLHALIAESGPALTIAERSAFCLRMTLAATDWVRENNAAKAAAIAKGGEA